MERVTRRLLGCNLGTSSVFSPPEYVAKFIGDENRLIVLSEAQ